MTSFSDYALELNEEDHRRKEQVSAASSAQTDVEVDDQSAQAELVKDYREYYALVRDKKWDTANTVIHRAVKLAVDMLARSGEPNPYRVNCSSPFSEKLH